MDEGTPDMLPALALIALGGALLGYSRAARATPGGAIPPPDQTGVPAIDDIVIQGKRSEFDIFARTIWAEARGELYEGMQAVANVIVNRFRVSSKLPGRQWWGETIEEICLSPNQFSAWRAGDPNRDKALRVTPADREFRQAQDIALRALGGVLPDITYGATHYHARTVRPVWAVEAKRTAAIGEHVFYLA